MKTLLLIDTTSQTCQVALSRGKDFWLESIEGPQLHTEFIIPFISKLFERSGITFEELDAVAVTQGPGSFTGVRVGFCIGQGLAYGWKIPLIPVPTLQVLAQSAFDMDSKVNECIVLIDARMNEMYVGHYQKQINMTTQDILINPLKEDTLLNPIRFLEEYNHINLKNDQKNQNEKNKHTKETNPEYIDNPIGLYGDGLIAYEETLKPLLIKVDSQYHVIHPKMIDGKVQPYLSLEALSKLAQTQTGSSPLEATPIYVRNQVAHKKKE